MRKNRCSLFLCMMGLLVVLGLMTACYRQAAPDVTPTPAGGVQAAPTEEAPPDVDAQLATARAESDRATQTAEAAATEAPTSPQPTPEPTETPIPPTPEPTTPAPTPPPTAPAPAPTSPPTGQVTHVVQRGENLFRIALRYGTTVGAVASANGIANPALIYVGQKLTIPSSGAQPAPPPSGGTTYVVQRGDNLFRIAMRYNISYLQLAQYNGISNPSRIYVGQVLRIPPR
jgi:LysM repeat protein